MNGSNIAGIVVPDPDLEMSGGGGGGGGHPDPQIRGVWSPKKNVSVLRASVWSTNRKVHV